MAAHRPSLRQQSSEDLRHATVLCKEGLESIVTFTPVQVVKDLPTPWPRCQELVQRLGHERKVPTKDDLVLAVSHAWSHQLHPDPLGRKAETIKELTEEAIKDHKIKGDAMLFYDFMSMNQNPFQPGQTERSPSEQADFLKAIDALPEVFFMADAVLHVEGSWPQLECETETRKVSWSEMKDMKLKQHGSAVMMYDEYPAQDGSVAELPVFTIRSERSRGDIKSIEDVHRTQQGKGGCLPCRRIRRLAKSPGPKSEAEDETDPVFIVQPSPMGKRNAIPAGERGWIYFERLVSTIRVALTDEQYAANTVYANAPDLKESILSRAQKLRQCAARSNEALKEQFENYIEEIKQKTFSATSMDKKRASTKNTATDVDLVFSLLTHLRRRVSLALAMTVRSLSVEDCMAYLEEKADLTIQDGRGYTALHNAARFRNVEVVELLLKHGAKPGARDRLGNTPAHVIPLYADEITLKLLSLLANDAKHLRRKNRAGLSVIGRMESWALVAVNGGPYKAMMDWIAAKKAELPDLVEDVAASQSARRHGRFQVSATTVEVDMGHETRPVRLVRPIWKHVGTVLYIGIPRFIPWSLQEAVLQNWAGAEGFRFFAINEDTVKPELLQDDNPQVFQDDLLAIVHALLPRLGDRFVLVDSSFGPGTFLTWRLRQHLQGALIINVHLFKAPDFDETELAQKIKKRMAFLGETYGSRDYDKILPLLSDFTHPTGGAEGMEEIKQNYKTALDTASDNFWDLARLQPSWNFAKLTPTFASMPQWPLEDSPPVVLASSDQAPLVVVGEAMQRLQQILPGSHLEFIPSSKWSWHLEGDNVTDAVASMMEPMLPSAADTLSMEIDVTVSGTERQVCIIQPEITPLAHVLYIGLPRFIPWSLQRPVLESWASKEFVKIFAINEDTVKPELLQDDNPQVFQDDLLAIVHALLPQLGDRFVLVDSSFGPGTFLTWRLRQHLQGALIINVHLFKAPDFDETELAQKIKKRMAFLGETYGSRDYDKILPLLSDFTHPTGGAEGMEEIKQNYKTALDTASDNFWDLARLQPSWNFAKLTPTFASMPQWPLEDSPPVVLASSDQAPLVVVGEAMQRLQQILPGSHLEFIPSSKWSWHLEGTDVTAAVRELLAPLLPAQVADHSGLQDITGDVSMLDTVGALPRLSLEEAFGAPCASCSKPCRVCPIQ